MSKEQVRPAIYCSYPAIHGQFSGAVGLAALLSGKLPHLKGKKSERTIVFECKNRFNFRVVSILTGGNIDSTVLGRTIERGLAVDGRLVKFDVNLIPKQLLSSHS